MHSKHTTQLFLVWFLMGCLLADVAAAKNFPKDGSDLATFVSRPDLKPPIFNISVNELDLVNPGYWFLAPYSQVFAARSPNFQPAHIGPHIFDGQGNLVWSGGFDFDQRSAFDLRIASYHGSPHLTFILTSGMDQDERKGGAGIILNNKFEVVAEVQTGIGPGLFNMHEFRLMDDGRSALFVRWAYQFFDASSYGMPEYTLWYGENGFSEVDVDTGKVIFDWNSLDYVKPWESYHEPPPFSGSQSSGWDYMHTNSIDKSSEGDYLVSARYMHCIYKVAGKDGSVIWRLGGKNSSFIMSDGLNFSFQHDARFVVENETTTIISLLDNASEGKQDASADQSAAMFVVLDTSANPMTATLLRSFARPDGDYTALRGSVQALPNNNVFVSWSENGYISEFSPEGRLLLEAKFMSDRLVTYRAYKFEFVGDPQVPPNLKVYQFGASSETISVFFVSWNGATEIATWEFYGWKDAESESSLLGAVPKAGFETTFTYFGNVHSSFAVAISADGSILGQTLVEAAIQAYSSLSGCVDRNCIPPALGGKSGHGHAPPSDADYGYEISETKATSQSIIQTWNTPTTFYWSTLVFYAAGVALLVGLVQYLRFMSRKRSVQKYSSLPLAQS